MTDEAKALVDHIRENYDLTECEHGFRLYEGHTCPNDFCDRRDMRRLTNHIETQAREIERLRDTPNRIWAEARDSEWDEGFNYAVKLFRAALAGDSHDA